MLSKLDTIYYFERRHGHLLVANVSPRGLKFFPSAKQKWAQGIVFMVGESQMCFVRGHVRACGRYGITARLHRAKCLIERVYKSALLLDDIVLIVIHYHTLSTEMSSLPYFTPEGTTTELSNGNHYSQAVRLPNNTIKISGQGGWHSSEGKVIAPTSAENIIEQVEQAFANVDNVLRNAGSKKGWGDVYLVRAYLVDQARFDNAVIQGWIQSVKKWCMSSSTTSCH